MYMTNVFSEPWDLSSLFQEESIDTGTCILCSVFAKSLCALLSISVVLARPNCS